MEPPVYTKESMPFFDAVRTGNMERVASLMHDPVVTDRMKALGLSKAVEYGQGAIVAHLWEHVEPHSHRDSVVDTCLYRQPDILRWVTKHLDIEHDVAVEAYAWLGVDSSPQAQACRDLLLSITPIAPQEVWDWMLASYQLRSYLWHDCTPWFDLTALPLPMVERMQDAFMADREQDLNSGSSLRRLPDTQQFLVELQRRALNEALPPSDPVTVSRARL